MAFSNLTGQEAFSLYVITRKLGGPNAYYDVFKKVQERINDLWPEIKKPISTGDVVLQEKRALELSVEDKSAFLHEFRDLFSTLKTIDRELVMEIAAAIGPKFKAKLVSLIPKEAIKVYPANELEEGIDVEDEDA